MNAVILAGGRGTRLIEETVVRPKPMVEIGGLPILWHIMQIYASQGFNEFIVALGYKGEVIKDYFLNYRLLNSDLRVDFAAQRVEWRPACETDWLVHLCDTGDETLTGGRLLRLAPRLREQGTFLVTYGDGLADVDLQALLEFHRRHGRLATVTAVRPPVPGKLLAGGNDQVLGFAEPECAGWVNGGFFVFEPGVFDYLCDDSTSLEGDALGRLAAAGELMAFKHAGFWQCMDTLQERDLLESYWRWGDAPWTRVSRTQVAGPAAMNRLTPRSNSRTAPLPVFVARG